MRWHRVTSLLNAKIDYFRDDLASKEGNQGICHRDTSLLNAKIDYFRDDLASKEEKQMRWHRVTSHLSGLDQLRPRLTHSVDRWPGLAM